MGPANESYCGGDTRSWQRYTRVPPIAMDVTVEGLQLSCRVRAPLKPATVYALVLLHICSRIREDKLFVFTTAGAATR